MIRRFLINYTSQRHLAEKAETINGQQSYYLRGMVKPQPRRMILVRAKLRVQTEMVYQ